MIFKKLSSNHSLIVISSPCALKFSLQPVTFSCSPFLWIVCVKDTVMHATVKVILLNTYLSLSVFPVFSRWNYSTAAVISLSQSRCFDRLNDQIGYCMFAHRLGHPWLLDMQRVNNARRRPHSTRERITVSRAGGSPHADESPAACLGRSVVQHNGIVKS